MLFLFRSFLFVSSFTCLCNKQSHEEFVKLEFDVFGFIGNGYKIYNWGHFNHITASCLRVLYPAVWVGSIAVTTITVVE